MNMRHLGAMGTNRKTTSCLRISSLGFALVLVFLTIFGSSVAKVEGLSNVEVSDYTFVQENYTGLDSAAKSVFYVEAYKSDNTAFQSGSGFILFDEKLFITNQHVIEGASFLVIMDDDGKQYILDQVVVSDKEHDIAILLFPDRERYNALGYDTAFDKLKRGQYVLAIGSPEGLPGTVSDGIISAFPKFRGEDIRYIQITAPISHGSSGGCLLNAELNVIGVTSGGVDEGQNLGFAIPVFIVEQLYRQWNKKDSLTLGTAESWDTVGYGLHNRISGAAEKPKIEGTPSDKNLPTQKPSEQNPPTQKPAQPVKLSGDFLDIVSETTQKGRTRYCLTINGAKLDWNQSVGSAAQFCIKKGIGMRHFDDDVNKDAYTLFDHDIYVFDTIPVNAGFHVRKSAKDTGLFQIDLNMERCEKNESLAKLIQSAQDVYQILRSRYGTPVEGIRVYNGSEWYDAGTNDISEAIEEKLVPLTNSTDHAFLTIGFGNLHLYISWQNGHYQFNLTLSAWLPG